LDLRRAPLQHTLRVRHRINQTVRRYFDDQGFLELETPFMVKYTPGGARNFLVPEPPPPGKFYALAESPQLFKQLFMVAGFDRYFQIVKCFRDEDLRLDRQPEFTQIDVEMSFVNQDDIFAIIEGLVFVDLERSARHRPDRALPERPLPADALRRVDGAYGNDKPDLRFGLEHTDLTDELIAHAAAACPSGRTSPTSSRAAQYRRDLPAEIVKAMSSRPRSRASSRAPRLDKLEGLREGHGREGPRARQGRRDGAWTQSPLAKSATPEGSQAINAGSAPKKAICSSSSSARVRGAHGHGQPPPAPREEARLIPEYGHGGRIGTSSGS
jgi:aspartyl-tRNA synthetase